ncbi:MAG: Gfo/Idh/MocA family protein [Tepidisphaerales bacterium]
MPSISRRRVLAAASAALAAPYVIPASALGADGRPAPSNRITMGCIGLGGRGTVDMGAFLGRDDVQIVALCDVDAGSDRYEDNWVRGLAPAVESVAKRYGGKQPAGYSDFRQLLERKDIDAVSIATPDHWHAGITVLAAASGKDIYCEKPMSLTVADGRAMVDAVQRYGRIFQCGSQRRSSPQCRHVCELVRNGRLGKLQTVRIGLPGHYWLRKNAKSTFDPEPVPVGFDYDLWLGPAPEAPYTYNRCHWNFRWNLDYSGGNVTDWGAHMVDVAHWGMGAEHTGPVEVEGKGTFPPRSRVWNAAESFEFTCTYASGVKMIVKSGGPTRFEGADGQLDFEGKLPPELAQATIGPDEVHLYDSKDHHGNFIDCVKSRRITAAPAEVAHRSITPSHLGNIAMQVGRKLRWDPQAERFIDDDLANRMLSRAYRGAWKV